MCAEVLHELDVHGVARAVCAWLVDCMVALQVFWILGSLIAHIIPGYFVSTMIGITTDMHTAGEMIKVQLLTCTHKG